MKRKFLITGGTKGIGFAISHHLSDLDLDVVGIARHIPKEKFPGDFFQCDLSNPDETQQTFNKIREEHNIDGIINNVGFAKPQRIEELDLNDFSSVIDINLRPAIQAIKTFLPNMNQQNWGRVVNISSRAMLGKIGRTSYSAAKAGLVAMTRTWAMELAKNGITVNAIAPGPINTEQFFLDHPKGSEAEEKIINGIPIGRMGAPEEVAHTVTFLLDERSGFITGQTIFVDGGGSLGAY